jgi:predicted ATPase/DNA-binding SARP family transcriptional activator
VAGLRITVLGGVAIERDGRVSPVRGTTLPLVLAVLASRANRTVGTETFIDALWARDPRRGRSALQVHVNRLREALGEPRPPRVLCTVQGGYRLVVAADELDIVRFEEQVEAGLAAGRAGDPATAAQLLADALRDWAEPFGELGTHHLLASDHARLCELRAHAEEERCEALLALGRNGEAAERLAGLVDEDPLRERRWAQRMLALYRDGRQGDALRCYQDLRRALGEVLGVDPSPALRHLEEAILLHDPRLQLADRVTAVQPINNLPPTAPLIGRDDAVGTVCNLLTTSRLVTVAGMGGVGKTRVALAAAHRALDDATFDGVYFVPLEGVRDGSLVATTIADALGLRGVDGPAASDAIVANLEHHTVLLVLDNAEHVLTDAVRLVDALLAGSPRLQVLATSRQPLDLDDESVYRLRPLPVPPEGASPDDVRASPSVQLFVERADATLPHDDATLTAVAAVCRGLGGAPLAIELAAARTVSLTPADIVGRLGEQLALLRTTRATDRTRHRSIEDSVAWSFSLLAQDEQELLRRLGVFRGGFSVDTCLAVVVDEELPEAQVLILLDSLVHKSLLTATQLGGARWFTITATLAQYCRGLLDEQGLREHFERRHRDAYMAFTTHASRHIADRAAETIARLEADHHNIRAALRFSIDHHHRAEAIAIAFSSSLFWMVHGYIAEGRRWFHEIAAMGEPPDAMSRGRLSQVLALIASVDADLPVAEARYAEADRSFGEAGDGAAVPRAWNQFWWARTLVGHAFLGHAPAAVAVRAEALYANCIEMFRRLENWNGVLTTLPYSAIARLTAGRDDAVEPLHELDVAVRLVGTDRGVSVAHTAWAMVHLRDGDPGQAAEHARLAIELCSRNTDRHNESIGWSLVALAALRAGDTATARASARDLLRLHRRHGSRLYSAYYLSVGWLALDATDGPAAADALRSLELMHPWWRAPLRLLGILDEPPSDHDAERQLAVRWPSWTAAHDRALAALDR